MLVWLLFNALVGALLMICAWGLQRVRKLPSHLVHAVWLLVIVRMVAPPIPEWAGLGLSTSATPPAALIESGAPAYQRELVEWMSQRFGNNWSGGLEILFLSLWALGVLVIVGREIRRERKLSREISNASSADPVLTLRVQRAAQCVGLRCDLPEIRVLDGLDSPFLWSPLSSMGRRALCVLPAQSASLPDSVLAHELVHLKRRDHWVAWAEFVAIAVFWWNPLAHMARRQLRVAAELACDEEVVRHYPEERHAYASALVETLERGHGGFPEPTLGTARAVGWNARELRGRLERILEGSMAPRPVAGLRAALAVCLLISLPGFAAPAMPQFAAWLPQIPNGISDSRAEEMLRGANDRLRANPLDGASLASRGRALVTLGRFLEAADTFQKQESVGHRPANAHYNRACALALGGSAEAALESLERALQLGIPSEYAVHDKDLASVRRLPAFQNLITR